MSWVFDLQNRENICVTIMVASHDFIRKKGIQNLEFKSDIVFTMVHETWLKQQKDWHFSKRNMWLLNGESKLLALTKQGMVQCIKRLVGQLVHELYRIPM
jgi:hypothetical protein